jgi:CheY-like chemotaxis protein
MSRRILIIDDEEDIRDVAALSLETVAGWDVVVANSGAQGVARALEHHPDAILLDVMMPGMDGPSTLRELRKNPETAKIPVLLLTAKVQSSDQRRFADLGVEAVLFKPFDPMTLSTQIASVLGWN